MRYVPNIITKIYDISPVWTHNLFSTSYGFFKTNIERNKNFFEILQFLNESQFWSEKKIEEYQNEKLKRLINHCSKNVPYYKKKFAEYGIVLSQIQNKEDLKKLPILSKNDIINNTNKLISKGYYKNKMRSEATSGTTGKPLTVYWDKKDYIWSVVTSHFIASKMGYIYKKDWLAIFNGYKILPLENKSHKFWIKDYYNKKIHFSTYHLSQETINYYYNYFKNKSLKYIIGYASLVGLFAKLINEMGKELQLEAVMLTSEPIYDWQVEHIKKAFNCKIINSYGHAERVVSGYSCDNSLNIHLFDEVCISEFILNEFNQHEIIGTSLINYGMPLIRYRIGDITNEFEGICKCNSNHTTIKPVKTKKEDFVITPDNKYISASLLTFPFKQIVGVTESQIVQNEINSIDVNLVVSENYSTISENKIKKDLQNILSNKININFNYIDKIPRTKNGKFRFVISKLQKP